ncbi:MAG: RidA family protein [Thermoplasmata archaeon]|nr:MAG: RidA family protein [Thermoplasmata archaeon]
MSKRVFKTESAGAAAGPYSQAVIKDDLIFISGQVAMDPKTNKLISGNLEQEVEQALANLRVILEEIGSSLEKVLKITVFLTDINEFSRFNAVYKKYFDSNQPARSCVEVAHLPLGAKVEIEAIAHL